MKLSQMNITPYFSSDNFHILQVMNLISFSDAKYAHSTNQWVLQLLSGKDYYFLISKKTSMYGFRIELII